MTNVVILTSSARGIASISMPLLARAPGCRLVGVILSRRSLSPEQRRRARRRRFRKVLSIGPLGALNGIRIRRWFGRDLANRLAMRTVEDLGRELGVPVIEVPTVGSEQTAAAIRSLRPDLGLSLGNGYIAPEVFRAPRLGMLNIHHEQLPEFRGAHSVIWQLYRGSRVTGYTIHSIDDRLDTGAILRQELVPIRFRPTLGETVTETLADVYVRSAHALVDVVANIDEALAAATPQGEGTTYTTPTIWQYVRIVRQHRRLSREFRTAVSDTSVRKSGSGP